MAKKPNPPLTSFELQPGRLLAGKYEVVSRLGAGYEGEVFRVRERPTGIERAAKLFFPHRNQGDRALIFYARKLDKLRHCPILIQYHTRESITYRKQKVSLLVSEYVEGDLLKAMLKRQPGGRLTPFEGLHLLYAMARGVERIHAVGEYHGDLHPGNVMVRRFGLGFEVKLLDLFHQGRPSGQRIREDVLDLIGLFYLALGGRKRYASHPQVVKQICRGLRHSLIWERFRTAGDLCRHMQNLTWEE